MASEKFVTRRVIEGTTYDIKQVDGDKLIQLDTRVFKGKPKEKELAKEFNVEKVICIPQKVHKVVYGVPVDKFMEIAIKVKEQ